MAGREGPDERAAQVARERVELAVREIRRARLGAGLTQAVVSHRVDVSRSRISRIERGAERRVPAELLIRMAAVVGLDLALRAYAGLDPALDAPQRQVLRRFGVRLGLGWSYRTEVVLPIAGDKRAWDSVWTHRSTGLVLHVEAESRLGDVQALLRRLALKRRDGAATRLVLVVADTRQNRAVSRAAARELAAAFPGDVRHAMSYLRQGRDPGADVLLLL